MRRLAGLRALWAAVFFGLASCGGGEAAVPVPTTIAGPMNDVEVVVGGTTDATDRLMSALMVVALEQRGALVIDRSNTDGAALNRDDLVAGRLHVVPEDIGTGWFIHLGQTARFNRTTDLAVELRTKDRRNGIEWSDHSSFDDALVAIAESDGATTSDGEPISVTQLAQRLEQSFDAVVCVDTDTLQSPEGLVRFEQATGFTVPAEQLEVVPSADLISAVGSGECTVSFVPGVNPAVVDAGLVTIDRFAPDGLPEVVFTPRNAAYMFDAEFYDEWSSWLSPFLETLMVTLDTETMTAMKADLADGDQPRTIARKHLERNDLL